MAKPKIVTPVIHIGSRDWKNQAEYLSDDFDYYHIDNIKTADPLFRSKPLFNNAGELNPVYRNAVFILDENSLNQDDLDLLFKLPANELLVNSSINLTAKSKKILDLKGAFYFDDKIEPIKIIKDVQHYFFYDPDGYRLDIKNYNTNNQAIIKSSKYGNIYHELELKPTNEWQLLMSPNDSIYIPAKMADKISLDYQTFEDNELALKLIQIDANSNKIIQSSFIEGEDLKKSFPVLSDEESTYVQALIYGKGKGKVRVGILHVRRSRGPYGEMMPNDLVIADKKLNSNVGIYFDAGDLKPPLNVYFAGYRTKEGYEGRRMMQNFKAPMILICDWRLEGGAFYLGDRHFEDSIVKFIKNKLLELGFKENDLILSGMSMGTFGAMYYGSKLDPKAIVLGKPLAEIGTIAQNGRVKRSNDFRTAEDIQLYFENNLSKNASDKLNDRFWHNFQNGFFSNTIFAIAYMFQDDYNSSAFKKIKKLFNNLTKNGKIISKGFEGRHNDQSGPVIEFFQRNYWHVLKHFGRERPIKKKKR